MYIAEDDKVYYCNPNETSSKELFITVHSTKDCTKTTKAQAKIIADILNKMR